MAKLLEKGIATRRGIMAIHREPCYRAYTGIHLPNTDRLTDNTLLLPLYPALSAEEQTFIINSIKEILTQ
jgi:dTDP-4-amino-4,6-dideoxygalactose transaminase